MERNDGPTEEVAKIASPGVDESTPLSPVPRSSISKPASDSSSPLTIDQARKKLIRETFGDDDTAAAIHLLLKDHDALKEKVGKLKALLGRSAKAQREAKVDLDATQKRLDQALREIERLNQKIDKLANRPSHLVGTATSRLAYTGFDSTCCFTDALYMSHVFVLAVIPHRNFWLILKQTLIVHSCL